MNNVVAAMPPPGGATNLWGAQRGTELVVPVLDLLEHEPGARDPHGPGVLVLLDLRAAESMTASFIKATVFRLQDIHLGDDRADDRPRTALNVYPIILGANAEVGSELDDVLVRHGRTCLEAEDGGGGVTLTRARLRGCLDPVLATSLRHLASIEAATAQEMHLRFPEGRPIAATAWNNRLNDLHARRLVRRVREGRTWRYFSIAKEISHG